MNKKEQGTNEPECSWQDKNDLSEMVPHFTLKLVVLAAILVSLFFI